MEILFSILLVVVGISTGFLISYYVINTKINNSSKKAEEIIETAKKEAEKNKRDSLFETKEEIHKLKLETEKEIKEKKEELKVSEDRLIQRENNMDKRDELFQKRELSLEEKEKNVLESQKDIQAEYAKIEEMKQNELEQLTKIAKLSKEEARKQVMKKVEETMTKEITAYIKEREDEAKLEADKKAKNLLAISMQRYAADIANEQTVTVVSLPDDELKGRNIRTIEAITGVDLIIDDTPEAVVLSSFDPLRREIARVTLEALLKDGRIHPTRIEELYDKVSKEMKQKIIEYGNDALFELGITKVDPALIEIIGKLHFRTSYGQNALQHSIEVAELSGLLASELGENVMLAKRAGLLHDIGKAIDHEVEGSHVEIGVDIAKKFGENEVVINSIASHHGDVEAESTIAIIVAIADALSASRPGARNDSLENYIKRLEQLENVAKDIDGVDKTYAVQAGRELRVIVKPEEVDDLGAHRIAREVKEKIESTMQYPGTIKVTVVRETRAQEEAK